MNIISYFGDYKLCKVRKKHPVNLLGGSLMSTL